MPRIQASFDATLGWFDFPPRALLALGVAANVWLVRSRDRWFAQFGGPTAYERRVHEWAESVSIATGPDAVESLERWLLAREQPARAFDSAAYAEGLAALVRELEVAGAVPDDAG